MKGLRRLFNMLFNRHGYGVNNIDVQTNSLECNREVDNRTAVKAKFRLQKVQDSLREIFLMYMEPFI